MGEGYKVGEREFGVLVEILEDGSRRPEAAALHDQIATLKEKVNSLEDNMKTVQAAVAVVAPPPPQVGGPKP